MDDGTFDTSKNTSTTQLGEDGTSGGALVSGVVEGSERALDSSPELRVDSADIRGEGITAILRDGLSIVDRTGRAENGGRRCQKVNQKLFPNNQRDSLRCFQHEQKLLPVFEAFR